MRFRLLAAACFAFATLLAGCSEVIPPLQDGDALRAVGDRCLEDWECGTGQCECEDFDCDRRFCAAADCLCGYGTSGQCSDALTGRQDPEDCDGLNESCGAIGVCERP